MATGDKSYTIWWTDPSAYEAPFGYSSNYDVYAANWDGTTNPTEVAITNYHFIYDSAEDTCLQTTYDNNSYCGSSFTLMSGNNKIIRIKPTSGYITADISINSNGTIQFFNCDGVVNNSNIYVIVRSVPKYFSKFSDGTNTYVVKDTEARSSLANKQDTLVSGTNIKTINNNSLLGSGNITLDSLPSQSGNSGKFLTTNGSAASWATVSIPTVDQTYDGTSVNAQSGVAVASAISSAISSVYKPAGSVTFASLPTPSSSNEGNVYNVTDSFTTTSDFVEGAGNSYPAGTNVVIIESNQTYYAWGIENQQGQIIGPYVYTLSVTPTTGDDVFEYNNNIFEDYGNVSSFSNNVLHFRYWAGKSDDYYRASSADVSGNVPSYYFDVLSGIVDLSGYVPTSRTINSKALTGNITLSASDVGALPDSTVIPTTTSQLTNNSGFITGISWGDITGTLSSQSDLNTALNNKANDSSVVHLSGDETINGGKTFNQAFIIGTTETHPNEGGQLIFKKSHNSTMAGDVIVDQNVNNLRVIGQSTSLGIIVPFYIDCENNKVYTATPATGDNSTQVATTAFVKAQGYATTSQIPTIDQTYNASSSNAQSGTAVASAISSAISSVYKPAGSVVFANLPTPSASNEGNVYNVTNAFTTTSNFVEGAGINYPAGTNVVIINTGSNTYKFDTLTGAFQPLLVSGTNIKTINSNSILGSGNLDIDALPSQTNNSGKFLTTNGTTASWGNVTIPYGESTSAADAVQKEVTISEITELKTGQVIIVKPTITSTVAESTLKLNNFTAYPMLYGSSAISTSTDSIVWQANYPSWFRFDGSNWVFIGHGAETTYSAMSVAEGTTGTATTARSIRADRLKQIIQGTTLTGLSTSTSSAVTEADTVTTGIGKLQAQVNNKVDKVSTASKIYATDAQGNQTTLSYSAFATGNTVPVRGNDGTIEAATPYANSHVTTKQYVDSLIPTTATTSTAGLVKPDGTTITITNDGTISASAGSYAMVIVDYTAEEE